MSLLALPSVVLPVAGFVLGFCAASGLCFAWRLQDRRTRRLVLGFAADALLKCLGDLVTALPRFSDVAEQAGRCRHLAAAVAKVAVE